MYLPFPLNPVTFMGYPWILFSNIPIAYSVLSGIRFIEVPVSTRDLLTGIWFMEAAKWRGLLWYEYPTSMSLLLKAISLVSCRKTLSIQASAILTKASVSILRSFAVSSNWSNKFLNQELLCKVMMAVASSGSLSSSSSLKSA